MKRIVCFIIILIIQLLSGCIPTDDRETRTTGFTTARLLFDQAGYYQLSSQTMRKAGLEVNGIEEILLSFKNEPYPFWYENHDNNQDFTLYFYVPEAFERLLTQIIMMVKTDNKTVQQSFANPLKLENITQEKIGKTGTILTNVEQQLLYLPKTGNIDPFLWTEIQNESFQFSLPVKGDLIENGNLTIELWSPTSAPVDFDHGIRVEFKGRDPVVFEWKGEGFHHITIPIPTDFSGYSIVLELSALKPDGVIAQIIYLDQLTIQTTQKLNMQDSLISVKGDDAYADFGKSVQSGYLLERDDYDTGISFVAIKPGMDVILKTRDGYSYDWATKASIKDDIKIMPVNYRNNIIPSHSVDWIVVSPDYLQETLQPLIAHRQNQGLSTFSINPQQIYDEYSGGFPDSLAFTSYFREYFEILGDLPDSVLMVGDYSYDRMDYLSAIKLVPSVWVHSDLIGETVSDMPLMDVNQDNRPEFVIGRIPVQEINQLKNWVDKVITSETALVETQKHEIVTIADDQEEYFKTDAKNFMEGFKFPYTTSSIETLDDKNGVNQRITEKLQKPVFLMVYFGHGSIDTWGKNKILSVKDVENFPKQTSFPVFLNLTCLTGYYVHPKQESLTEALLLTNEAGAVAVLAPTSLTSAVHQQELLNQLVVALQNPKNDQMGDVLLDAWSKMDLETLPLLEVMQTFGLFGDPAMILFP